MWKINIQHAINWIDDKLEDDITLKAISNYLGYSEFHTSRKFKEYTGSTLKRYIMLRKLTMSARMLRDKNVRIIDVAFQFGFSSQEAFTKSFNVAFGLNPGVYQKNNKPIPYFFKKDVLFPDNLTKKGAIVMVKDEEIRIRLEETKEHKFIYIKRPNVTNYMDFWETVDAEEGMDCDYLHGILSSIPGKYPEGYGGFTGNGYLFGTDASIDYDIGDLPFEEIIIPTKKYLVFEHPGFTEESFSTALNQVRKIALETFDFKLGGYVIDDSFVKAFEHSGLELCYYYIRIPLQDV